MTKLDAYISSLSNKNQVVLSLVGFGLIGFGSLFLLPLTLEKFLTGSLLILCGFLSLSGSLSQLLVGQTKIRNTISSSNKPSP